MNLQTTPIATQTSFAFRRPDRLRSRKVRATVLPKTAGLALVLTSFVFAGCTLPSDPAAESEATVQVSSAAEGAAQRAYQAIGETAAMTGRVARVRYVSILEKYPGTRAAYEANIDLARDDFAGIETQKATARTNKPIAESSREFMEFFAYGDHAHPPMPDLQQRYRAEMHPMYFEAVKNIGTWQATLKYLEAYPDNPYTDQIESSIEAAIVNPNAGWEAAEILSTYREIRPERAREQQLAARVETHLFQRLSSSTSFETLQRFLQTFPFSIYTGAVEDMIDEQLGRKITVYTGRKGLENIIRERPGTVDAAQAREALEALEAQEEEFRSARSRNSVAALVEFMETHPSSRFLTDAARRIEELKLASISSAQRSRLEAYRSEIDREMRSEETELASYDSRLQKLRRQIEDARRESREVQTKSYDLAAEAREHRRQAQRTTQVIRKIRQAMRQDPDLKSELEERRKKRGEHLREAKRLEEEAAAADREAGRLKDTAAELEVRLGELRDEAHAVRVEALEKRNRMHHEYLARLDEAWRASGGSA